MAVAVPDFGSLASQQAAANNAATDKTNLANRSNQSGPMGSLTWTQGPNGQWTQNTALGGAQQGLFDSTISGQQGLAGTIGAGVNYGNLPAMPDSGFGASQQVIDAWNALQQPGLDKSADAARTRAAAMGLTIGSNANNDIERTIGTNEATSRNQGILQGTQEYQNVFNRGLAARQQGVTEANNVYDRAISGSASLGATRDSLNPNKWLGTTSASAAYLPENIYGAALDTFSANQAQQNASQAQSNANRAANTGLLTSGINALGGVSGIAGGAKSIWDMFSGGSGGNGITDYYGAGNPTWGTDWGNGLLGTSNSGLGTSGGNFLGGAGNPWEPSGGGFDTSGLGAWGGGGSSWNLTNGGY